MMSYMTEWNHYNACVHLLLRFLSLGCNSSKKGGCEGAFHKLRFTGVRYRYWNKTPCPCADFLPERKFTLEVWADHRHHEELEQSIGKQLPLLVLASPNRHDILGNAFVRFSLVLRGCCTLFVPWICWDDILTKRCLKVSLYSLQMNCWQTKIQLRQDSQTYSQQRQTWEERACCVSSWSPTISATRRCVSSFRKWISCVWQDLLIYKVFSFWSRKITSLVRSTMQSVHSKRSEHRMYSCTYLAGSLWQFCCSPCT